MDISGVRKNVATFHSKTGGKTHAEAHTWKQQPGSLGPRARLHGHEHQLRPAADKQEMIRLLHSAVERGMTFFDTAQVYGPFTNEELVGEALSPLREQVVIATKFGFEIDSNGQRVGLNSRPEFRVRGSWSVWTRTLQQLQSN